MTEYGNKFLYFALGLVLLLAGCSSLSGGVNLDNPSEAGSSPTETSAKPYDEADSPPIAVRILSERRLGDLLTVKVELTPETDLPSKSVALSLVGLTDGSVVAKESIGLDQVTGAEKLEEGEPIPVLLSLTHSNLNEYQVRAAWGDDRNTILSQTSPPPEANPSQKVSAPMPVSPEMSLMLSCNVSAVEREEENCARPPCAFKYIVTVDFTNATYGTSAGDIVVAAGFAWVGPGSQPVSASDWEPIKSNEEALPLNGINISAGENRRIRIRLDTQVPVLPGGEYRPTVRLLSAKAITQ
jgi:hypothetical protein